MSITQAQLASQWSVVDTIETSIISKKKLQAYYQKKIHMINLEIDNLEAIHDDAQDTFNNMSLTWDDNEMVKTINMSFAWNDQTKNNIFTNDDRYTIKTGKSIKNYKLKQRKNKIDMIKNMKHSQSCSKF